MRRHRWAKHRPQPPVENAEKPNDDPVEEKLTQPWDEPGSIWHYDESDPDTLITAKAIHPGGKGGPWVYQALTHPWIAALRIKSVGGSAVVAGLTIYAGGLEGSLDLRAATSSQTPLGGLTTRAIRKTKTQITPPEKTTGAQQIPNRWLRIFGEPVLRTGLSPSEIKSMAAEARRNPGRRGRPDHYYAKVAADYVAQVAKGTPRPVEELAAKWKLKSTKMRDLIHTARSKELLTGTAPGEPGGELTAKAKKLLQETKPTSEPTSKPKRRTK